MRALLKCDHFQIDKFVELDPSVCRAQAIFTIGMKFYRVVRTGQPTGIAPAGLAHDVILDVRIAESEEALGFLLGKIFALENQVADLRSQLPARGV